MAGTETVKIHTHEVYGITVRIIDMPGLKPSASDARHNARILAQVSNPKPVTGQGHMPMQNRKRKRPPSSVFQGSWAPVLFDDVTFARNRASTALLTCSPLQWIIDLLPTLIPIR